MSDDTEMLDFVKALAHADRLKIVGMLVQKPERMADDRSRVIPSHPRGV